MRRLRLFSNRLIEIIFSVEFDILCQSGLRFCR
ncbi:hypothetical protein BVI434_800026 [Burkholderia vietnamiensis]|nr:hypothetical protein BVI434_800026 [Burkholderia vietnamiensis]